MASKKKKNIIKKNSTDHLDKINNSKTELANSYESDVLDNSCDSDESEIDDDNVSKKATNNYIKTDFLEKVIKYIKYDDLIRKENLEHKERISSLKDHKSDLEIFILRYLDTIEQDIINIGENGKLIKYESTRMSSLNGDIIKQSIFEQLKKENLYKDENKCKELVENTFNLMQNKREKKTKVCLKRTIQKPKKDKKINNKSKTDKK